MAKSKKIDPKSKQLGKHLVEDGSLSKEHLELALGMQKKTKQRLGEILVENGFVSEKALMKALSAQFNLECVDLAACTIEGSLLRIFLVDNLREWKVFPVKLEADRLTVAMTNPLDMRILQGLKYLSGYRIDPVLATSRQIFDAIAKYYTASQSFQEAIQEINTIKKEDLLTDKMSSKELEAAVNEAPVVRLVNSVITEAIKQKASDVHFEPLRDRLRVRFRIDGVLYEGFTVPKGLQPPVISRMKIISGMDIAERRRPQDGRIGIAVGGKEYDIRASTLPDLYGEKMVLRILDKKSILVTVDSLGLDAGERDLIESLIHKPYGIILLTGPTGSGKTTSLYSFLNQLNDATRNIVTVEDPVEYELEGITQTIVNVKAGYTFATGLRHILRQDPDIIMIGEIRDMETAEIAIQAALTGHLVFSTLHTNTSSGAMTRLLDMNIEPFLISSAIIGVIAQRLVRRLCQHCKKEQPIPAELLTKIRKYFPDYNEKTSAVPVGCKKCGNRGYAGRIAIFEILNITPQISELILKRADEPNIAKCAMSQGMLTLAASAFRKVTEKITSLEEAIRVSIGDIV